MRTIDTQAFANGWRGALLFLAMLGSFAAVASAGPLTPEEKQFCRDDYHRFCQGLAIGSDELRDCMNKAGRHLSHDCVSALIDAGEVSKVEVDRRKRQ